MTLRDLLAVFVLEESNFNILHWNCDGKKFDRMHTLAEEWYNRCSDNKDAIAEMAIRCGLHPIHYGEAIGVLKEAYKETNIDFKLLTSDDTFDWDEFMQESQSIIGSIIKSIILVLESDEIQNNKANIGIKATLEGILEEWDLDYRYKNTHRK